MKRCIRLLSVFLLVFPLASVAATKEEAKALVEKAAALINAEGIEAAKPKLHDPQGEFVKGELYIFVIDYEGNTLIHGGKPAIVGKNLFNMKDPNGVFFLQDMVKLAKKDGQGWTRYHWSNPKTNKVSPKVTYVMKLSDGKSLAGCGIYE